ncbi:MAG: hypothetical protein H6739_14310 [Alphaproteobacteria bacterium]|nr:hypothetical protein [Alphaproteobacteria bacterium]
MTPRWRIASDLLAALVAGATVLWTLSQLFITVPGVRVARIVLASGGASEGPHLVFNGSFVATCLLSMLGFAALGLVASVARLRRPASRPLRVAQGVALAGVVGSLLVWEIDFVNTAGDFGRVGPWPGEGAAHGVAIGPLHAPLQHRGPLHQWAALHAAARATPAPG